MEKFDASNLKKLFVPEPGSHKGQNGKVLIIGGSILFHAGSLWPLEIASKIVDMVFYSSVDENNKIAKEKFSNGIVIPRNKIEDYLNEADAILIGSGLPREEGMEPGDDDTKALTSRLLKDFPDKKWVIDGGSLQVITPEILPKTAIITPHRKEFEKLFNLRLKINDLRSDEETVIGMAKKFGITILLKGPTDIVSNGDQTVEIPGGNAGMTKGGTGDVLAGLTVSLYSKNDAFPSACAASYINKKAGENLSKTVGLYFNASDLLNEIPRVMKKLI